MLPLSEKMNIELTVSMAYYSNQTFTNKVYSAYPSGYAPYTKRYRFEDSFSSQKKMFESIVHHMISDIKTR